MTTYRLFNFEFSCAFPLPELPVVESTKPLFSVVRSDEASESIGGIEKRFEFTDKDGVVSCWSGRRGDDYLLVFPGFAAYRVVDHAEIRCMPEKGCPFEMVRHLLINQVIPRLLGSWGHLVVHASAISLPGGNGAAAFLGHSGHGKSTLASSFHRHGAELISDDGILICLEGNGPLVFGGMPGVRLLPDSRDAIFADVQGFRPVTPFSAKRQLSLKDGVAGGLPLAAVFILADPAVSQGVMDVHIERMAGPDALVAIIQNMFTLDPTERPMATRGFENAGVLMAGQLPVCRLSYPRDLGRLDAVREAVENFVSDHS